MAAVMRCHRQWARDHLLPLSLRAQAPYVLAHARGMRTASARASFARRSALWVPTERENPADAAIPSHQLLIRGGFLRKSGHGTFAMLPLGKRVMHKLEALIDDEMQAIRGNKVDLPLLIPAELWERSGRWQTRSAELLAFPDRRGDMQTLAPTHEESITSLVAAHYGGTALASESDSESDSASTLRLYQVGRKFRDEIRPRFGLLRAREFVMKDMYSFDTSYANALTTYDDVVHAYDTILRHRLALPIARVEADSGNIGGNLSHEFHVLSEVGEDALLSCQSVACSYAANVEKARGRLPESMAEGGDDDDAAASAAAEEEQDTVRALADRVGSVVENADVTACVASFLLDAEANGLALAVKCRVVTTAVDTAVVLVRRDREVNPLLLKPFCPGEEEPRLLSLDAARDQDFTNQPITQLFMDDSLLVSTRGSGDQKLTEFILDSLRPLASSPSVPIQVHEGHFRVAKEGDKCPSCTHGSLEAKRGIEVGHVFYLGQKYSKPFRATFLPAASTTTTGKGKTSSSKSEPRVLEMGCYGLGVSRLLAAVVECSHDAQGMIWPTAIAPFQVVVLAIGAKRGDDAVALTAQQIARELSASLGRDEVLLDDRWRESAGSKLTEAELIGYPFRVVVGKRFASEGLVEVLTRATMEKTFLLPSQLGAFLAAKCSSESSPPAGLA